MAKVIVDISAVKKLGEDILAAKNALLGELAQRGRILLREEVPQRSRNLWQGVGTPDVDYANMTATLTVQAVSDPFSGRAQVFDKNHKLKKTITLRPQPAYDYADVVARGNKKATMTPTHARAFMIPVAAAPSEEGYLSVGGQIYVIRRSKKGMKPNPYDERAATRLQGKAAGIAEGVLRKFV